MVWAAITTDGTDEGDFSSGIERQDEGGDSTSLTFAPRGETTAGGD